MSLAFVLEFLGFGLGLGLGRTRGDTGCMSLTKLSITSALITLAISKGSHSPHSNQNTNIAYARVA